MRACVELPQPATGDSARLGRFQSFPAAFGNLRFTIASHDGLFRPIFGDLSQKEDTLHHKRCRPVLSLIPRIFLDYLAEPAQMERWKDIIELGQHPDRPVSSVLLGAVHDRRRLE